MSSRIGASTKGYIKNANTGRVVSFIYNPQGFQDTISATYNEIQAPGSSYPKFQYVNGNSRGITLELFIYDPSITKLRGYIDFLEEFMPLQNGKFNRPPILIFAFGNYVKSCILESLSRDFVEFDRNLNPTLATITLGLKVV